MTNVDDQVYFFRWLGSGYELWRTDGTAAGTARISSFDNNSRPTDARALNGELYFITSSQVWSTPEGLWTSDGTPGGTRLVKEIDGVGTDGNNLTSVDGVLFFTVGSDHRPVDLWRSDGTPGGTVPLKSGVAGPFQRVGNLTDVQGTLYFTVQSNYVDQVVWKSDGTSRGTAPVFTLAQIEPNTISTRAIGNVYLLSTQHHGLWRTDGTPGGTFQLIEKLASITPPPTTEHRGLVYLAADDGSGLGEELWVTDGTRAGTRLVRDIHWGEQSSSPVWMASIDAGLIFQANAGRRFGGPSLWISDSTRVGTRKVKDLARFNFGSYPSQGTVVGKHLYFLANTGNDPQWHSRWELWRSDGTRGGTRPMLDLIDGFAPRNESYRTEFAGLQGVGDTVYVSGQDEAGWGLWRFVAGSEFEQLTNVVPMPPLQPLTGLTGHDGKLYFFSDTDTSRGLWRLDAGRSEAVLLTDGLAAPSKVGIAANRLVFNSDGDELWWSDGTAAGTRKITSLALGPDTRIDRFESFGDRFIFRARWEFNRWGNTNKTALWISDGTAEGTKQLRRPYPGNLHTTERGILYTHFSELWLSDGSSRGMVIGEFDDFPRSLTRVGSQFYFSVSQSLWRTDGTRAGTVQVVAGWEFFNPTAIDGELYFNAMDPETGEFSLRKLAGPGETILIAPDVSVVQGLETGGGRFIASKRGGAGPLQVWETDGTAAGTRQITSFERSPRSFASVGPFLGEPWEFMVDGTLLLVADDGTHGPELWAFGTPDPSVQGTLGDFVWLDGNENGVQDEEEPGLPGVMVHLETCTGTTIATTLSDPAGAYALRGLTAGDYRLRFDAPFAHVFSPRAATSDYRIDSNPDPATGTTSCVALASPQQRMTIDAGLILEERAQVGDRIWHDLDRDGVQDHHEPGFAQASVVLETCGGSVLQTATTDGNGRYLFDWLADGEYRLRFVAPGGYTFSPKNAIDDFRIDSNAHPVSGLGSCRSVRAGQQRLALDAGLMPVE